MATPHVHKDEPDLKRNLEMVLEGFQKAYVEIESKRGQIEKPHLEETIEVLEHILNADLDIISEINELLVRSKDLLTQEKIEEAIDAVNSMSPGQIKYYRILLALHNSNPRFYTTREIAQASLAPERRPSASLRTTIQKLFAGKPEEGSKGRRGSKKISVILETMQIKHRGRLTNVYRPKGFLANLSEIFFYLGSGLVGVKINSELVMGTKRRVEQVLTGLKNLELVGLDAPQIERAMQSNEPNVKERAGEILALLHRIKKGDTVEYNAQLGCLNVPAGRFPSTETYTDLQKTLEKENIMDYFDHLSKEDLGPAYDYSKSLELLARHMLEYARLLETCLYLAKLRKAKLQGRYGFYLDGESHLSLPFRYEGTEPHLRLKKEQDKWFSKGIIDKNMYERRMRVLEAQIKNLMKVNYSFSL